MLLQILNNGKYIMKKEHPLTVPQIITLLEETSSKNGKLEILQKYKDNELLRLVVERALDPYTVYYMKKVPDYVFTNKSAVKLDRAIAHLDKLSSRQKSGKDAKLFVQQILSQLDEGDANVLTRVLTKDLKAGFGASTVNKAWGKDAIPVFDVMLCSKNTEKALAKIKFPAAVEEKMDGMRVIFKVTQQGVDVLSRSGKDLGLSELFRNELFHLIYANNLTDTKGYMVDGELLCKEGNGSFMARKKANGILNKAIKGTISEEEKQDIYAVVWDIIPVDSFNAGEYNVSYQQRKSYLGKRFDTLATYKDPDNRRMELLETKMCDNMDEVLEIYKEFINKGSEGIILKDVNEGWKNKRVWHHIKFKVEETADLIITEVVGGQGRLAGKLGNFIVSTKAGDLSCGVGSGFSDAERAEYFTNDMVGKIVEVKYNELISSKNADVMSLFLPVFVKIRHDKKIPDTLTKLQKKK